MSPRQAFASFLQFFVVFAIFSAGLFFTALPYLPDVRMRLEMYLLNRFEVFTLIGFGLLITALLLAIGFYGLNRGRYLRIKMGERFVEVDSQLIRLTVEECLRAHFPKKFSSLDIEILRSAKLEIGVQLARTDKKECKELFLRVERELENLLRQRFGYTKPFYLIVRPKS